ncbi:uncharacterized protein LOC143745587 [Siphateles boraxobius]|uniref:uncharacterized protein LOC143745587 n=1 Tax=Siphateles boraxobius TaxID=180520 RepID=UPI004062C4AD
MLQKFIHGLSAIGLETKDDLQYVKEEDLMEFLRPIQCRKLLNAWKNEEQSSCSTPQRSSSQVLSDISSPGSESSSSTPSCSTACFSASCAWAETFKVPWEVMPSGIKLAIANKKRPSPADRRKLVRMLVDNMQKHEVNATKAQCQIVVQNIVKQYPDSFADVLSGGSKIGSGYASLLLQVKTWGGDGAMDKTHAFEEFPAGENDDTLEEKRKQMVLLHSTQGMSGGDREELYKLMEVTYYRDLFTFPIAY